MFEVALKARLPMIGVQTEDFLNLEDVLQLIAQRKPHHLKKVTAMALQSDLLFWTGEDELATTENYELLRNKEQTLVLVNTKPNPLVFNVGELPVPQEMLEKVCAEYGQAASPQMLQALKGLTIKSASELLLMTSAKYGNLLAKNIRLMRQALGQSAQGLYPLTTEVGYYEPDEQLQAWLNINAQYFLNPKSPPEFVPRGLVFAGVPGVGKTMAARYIANTLHLPLYRMDVATVLNRYIGESENRFRSNLQMIERESPCVVLFDEIEKVFVQDADGGTIERMLSQLLWWLSDHESRVLSIMTTNNLQKIPVELYRTGRIDQVIVLHGLSAQAASSFTQRLITEMLKPNKPSLKQLHSLNFTSAPGFAGWSHSDVQAMVVDLIKKQGWLKLPP